MSHVGNLYLGTVKDFYGRWEVMMISGDFIEGSQR
jgi:hypothetical protein